MTVRYIFLRKALVLFNLSLATTKINSSDIPYGYEDVSTYRVRLYKNFSEKTVCDHTAPNVFDVVVFCAVQWQVILDQKLNSFIIKEWSIAGARFERAYSGHEPDMFPLHYPTESPPQPAIINIL